MNRITAKLSNQPLLFVLWLINFTILPLMAYYGNELLNLLETFFSGRTIGMLIGAATVIIIMTSYFSLSNRFNYIDVVYLIIVLSLLGFVVYYLADNTARWLHIPLFVSLGFLSCNVFSRRTGAEFSLSYAFIDELFQYYLSYRTGSFEDVLINAFCASVGILFYWILIE